MKFLVGAHKSLLLVLIFMVFMVGKSLRPHHYTKSSYSKEGASTGDEAHDFPKEAAREEAGMEVYPTGSSLPDCSHACGPCTPCKRVMNPVLSFTGACVMGNTTMFPQPDEGQCCCSSNL
uniref:Epidermal patterning factor-like protein n=1 Tax=Salix viminalis TaxID=40686 RepID=A0A6N2MNU8_SALVM